LYRSNDTRSIPFLVKYGRQAKRGMDSCTPVYNTPVLSNVFFDTWCSSLFLLLIADENQLLIEVIIVPATV
jgi:hypothetical protein